MPYSFLRPCAAQSVLTRTLVYDKDRERGSRTKVVEKGPKTDAGGRVLPLPYPVFRALKATRVREKLAACDAHRDSGYVIVDELGRPLQTNKLRYEAYRLMEPGRGRRVGETRTTRRTGA